MKLRIRNVQQGDFMEYRCVAKNSLGGSDGTITLYGKWFNNIIEVNTLIVKCQQTVLTSSLNCIKSILLLALPFTWNYLRVPGVNLSTSPASPTAPSAAPASASSSTLVGLTSGTSETLTKALGEISPVVCQSFTRPFWFVPASFGSTSASLLRLLRYCRFGLITKERYWIH